MAILSFAVAGLAALAVAPASAHTTGGRSGWAMIGFGIRMYDPACADSCRGVSARWPLDCGDDDSHHGDHSGHGGANSPECYATNDPFLETLAYCISTHCEDVAVSKIEKWWELNVAGRQVVQPSPKYSYSEALFRVKTPPTAIANTTETLTAVSLINEDSYIASYNGNHGFENFDIIYETYGIVVFVTCVAIPVVFSWFRLLPLPQSFVSKFYATFIDPPVFGKYHAVPVLGLGFVPTRGQALFIGYIWIINIILSAVNYELLWPNAWYSSFSQGIVAYVGDRVGMLSFANLALAVLFSSRNNLLLHLTNWSHSTFLLLHRWIAVICMLQACLHSALWLQIYLTSGPGAYDAESKLEYWIWGIIATFASVFLCVFAVLPIRQRAYELFLSTHIVLALLCMIGCLLHIYYRFEWQWGYQIWPIITFAFWGFDRFLARPLRLLSNGVKEAHVTVVDEDYLKVEIPGAQSDGHVYLYFPTLTWRVWENHPFSVAAISSRKPMRRQSRSESGPSTPPSEKADPHSNVNDAESESQEQSFDAGIVFYVRRHGGLTGQLMKRAESGQAIPVLIEGPYGSDHMSVVGSPLTKPTLKYPNLICIAGGVGITAVLPVLTHANGLLYGRTKLYWGVRTAPLVKSVENMLGFSGTEDSTSKWGNADVTVSVGPRFDLKQVLEADVREMKGGITVAVCGPAGMADDVRAAVTSLAKTHTIRLAEESFFW